jgi:hypothetical protein
VTIADRLIPGHVLPLCRGCVHFDGYMYNQGHPNPCRMVRWIGHKHHVPSITADASGVVGCDSFEPTEGSAA